MKRAPEIQKDFEVADDSLQTILGYHLYTIAVQKSSDKAKIAEYFPDVGIRITFAWNRYYDRQELIDFFSSALFELIQARVSLIYVTSVFEDVLNRFVEHLNEKQFRQKCGLNPKYKDLILWAYRESKRCPLCVIGNEKTLEGLPTTFGIIDNARRLRNLIVHNHGLFNTKYEDGAIRSDGIKIELHNLYSEFKRSPQQAIPAIIRTEDLCPIIWAHTEALHVLHNSIQEEFFGVTEGYSYKAEKKRIELKRILLGNSEVEI